MKRIKRIVNEFLHSLIVKKGLGCTNKAMHVMYFGAVAIEAHGNYAIFAGALGVLFIANVFIGFGD